MLEFLIVLLITGFVFYYLMRHPLRSLKYASVGVGLLILGVLGLSLLLVLAVTIASL